MKLHYLAVVALILAGSVRAEETADLVLRGSAHYSPNVKAIAGSTDRNYITEYDRLVRAATEAVEEEAHVDASQIERTDDGGGCSCGGVTYLKAPYIDFSWIKVKIDGRGKDSCAPELSVTITTDKTFFTRHKEYEQRVHELVLLKLSSKKHGAESIPPSLPPVHSATPPAQQTPTTPSPAQTPPSAPAPTTPPTTPPAANPGPSTPAPAPKQ